jgi:hypothetical protein
VGWRFKSRRCHPKFWTIYRLSARAIYLGQVTAPDETKAIKVAIKEIPVTNPNHQQRLVARKAN